MATSTNAVKSYRSVLSINTNGIIRLEVPTETRGIRILEISTVSVKLIKLTDAEESVMNWLTDGLESGKVYPIDITLTEIQTLGGIKSKIETLYNKPKTPTTQDRIQKTTKINYQEISSRTVSSGLDAVEAKVNRLQEVVKKVSTQYTYL